MSICESKLDESFPSTQFSVKGFRCYRQDSTATSGGLIAFFRNDLPCNRRDDLSINDEHIQSLIVEMRVRKEKWFVVCLYRLPSANVAAFSSNLSEIVGRISRESSMVIALGDVNIDLLKNNGNQKALKGVMDIYGLKNVVKEPTCYKGTPSLIDVILTSNAKRVGKVLNFDCGLSDYHNLLATCTKMDVAKPKAYPIAFRSYKDFDEEAFKRDMDSLPLSVIETFDDVSDKHWAYSQLVMPVVNHHAPLKTRYETNRCAHMNSKLRKAIYIKRVARNRHLKAKGDDHTKQKRVRMTHPYR